MTESLAAQLSEIEQRLVAESTPGDLEQAARLARACDREEDAQAYFRRAAERKIQLSRRQRNEFHLQVGNLFRLAGDDRASDHLRRAVEDLQVASEDLESARPKYLFALLLVGDDARLIAEADRWGEDGCDERCWTVVEAVRADLRGDEARRGEMLSRIDRLAEAEAVATDNFHPSNLDLQSLLHSRFSDHRLGSGGEERSSAANSPWSLTRVAPACGGRVVGWWGTYVMVVDPSEVRLVDTASGGATDRAALTIVSDPSWRRDSVLFVDRGDAYVVSRAADGIGVARFRLGDQVTFTPSGSALVYARGFEVDVVAFDGSVIGSGRWPIAVARGRDRLAIGATDGGLSIVDVVQDGLRSVAELDVAASAIGWFPAADRIALAEDGGQSITVIEIPSGRKLDESTLHDDGPITSIDVAAPGDRYASVGHDGNVAIRDLTENTRLSVRADTPLEAVAFDSSGELLAVSHEQGWQVHKTSGAPIGPTFSTFVWNPEHRRAAGVVDDEIAVVDY